MYRKVRENSRPMDLRLFTSTKEVVSVTVIKTSCAHSVTLKRINKTHVFLHFHIVIWTRKLLWKYMCCLSKLLLHELWPKQLRERFIIVAKLYIFLLKKQDNYLRRSYPPNLLMLFNVTQYVYLMFNVRILYSMEVVHQKQQIL